MKPFNIELAKQGHKVQTRDGKPVRILCYDKKCKYSTCPIIALVDMGECEIQYEYTISGHLYRNKESDEDLFMVPKEGWIILRKSSESLGVDVCSTVFETKEKAEEIGKINDYYFGVLKIEWEE